MNCHKYWLRLAAVMIWCAATGLGLAAPMCKVTLRVVDEDGQPVPAADVTVTFEKSNRFETKQDKTNPNGLCSAEGETSTHIDFGAIKEGFYHTVTSTNFFRHVGNHWHPWNPIFDLVLKKILNPVPMYARRVETEIPIIGQPAGYDLMEADWVAPHGKGQKADFVLTLHRRFSSRDDFEVTLELSFSNSGDGIQSVLAEGNRSTLRLPHSAPESGYESSWSRAYSSKKSAMSREGQNYFFRVRSEQKDGSIKQALYGKIHGEIQYDVRNSKTAILLFTYYLNPNGTQNLEFDPKRNLFKNLKLEEDVRQP